MLGFIVALEEECRFLIKKFIIVKQTYYNSMIIYECSFNAKNFVLIISGVGRKNAIKATKFILKTFDINFIINFGSSCGGINCCIGDIFVVEKAFTINKKNFFPTHKCINYLSIIKENEKKIIIGNLLTANKFITKYKDRFFKSTYCIDMEYYNIIKVCKKRNVNTISLKVITDIVNQNTFNIFSYNLMINSIKLQLFIMENFNIFYAFSEKF